MKKSLFAGVSLFAFAGAASGADLPRRVPAPDMIPAGFSWTGFYVGGHTGIAVGRTTTGNTSPYGGFDAGIPLSYDLNPVSVFGGGQLGYNWQYGVYVLGVEADLGYLGLRETVRPAPDDYVSVKYGWYGTVTGRLGFAYDRLLTYVKGGAAVASITNAAGGLTGGVIDPSDYSAVRKTRLGWTVGSGFELAFAPNWSFKSEYLYMNFGKQTSTNLDGDSFTHKNQVHTWKVGLNYRFGGAAPVVVARY
ncbi:MAG: porin family protein [Xanthobacteraceae bacterium]|nr:porin family protein [Xanthobacteraceae bacterium]